MYLIKLFWQKKQITAIFSKLQRLFINIRCNSFKETN